MTVSLIWTGAARVGALRKGEQHRKRLREQAKAQLAAQLAQEHTLRVVVNSLAPSRDLPIAMRDAALEAGLKPGRATERSDPLTFQRILLLGVKGRRLTTSLEPFTRLRCVQSAEWVT